MIKIMHVITDMKFGGAGRWLVNLISATDYNRFEVTIIIPIGSVLRKRLQGFPVTIIEAEGLENTSFNYSAVKYLKKYMKDEKIDIVHTHACLSAKIAAKILGKKIIFTKHCMENNTAIGLKLKLKRSLNGYLTDQVIAVSNAVCESMKPVFPKGMKFNVVYSGVEPLRKISEEGKKDLREQMQIKDEDVVIGIVARLAPVKAHEFFIEAANLVAKKRANVKFLIVGDGQRETELKQMVASKKSLNGKLIFTGFIEDVAPIMNIMDINVVTSINEALCLSVIEGMSLSIPAVVSKTGGLPEVVEHNKNGLLISVGNTEKFAEALLELIDDPKKRMEMGARGAKSVKEKFNIEVMVKKTEEIYESLL